MADINFILLYVEDVAASEAFYAAILGRKALESSPTFSMLAAASGLKLGLWKRDGVEPAATATVGGGEIAFAVEGAAAVDSLCAEWRGKGARVAQSPTRMDFGYTCVILDPDGHRLRIFAPGA
ncbi:MAG: drug:proton antiporter [Bradyrhizobium sp.]|nr:MAG: drug:proton antiporter [Bradyrhizobium sp.]